MSTRLAEIFIFGTGKVGRALARALRRADLAVTTRAGRRGWPKRPIDADLTILALRDGQIEPAARDLAAAGLLGHRRKTVAVVHCAGALGPEVLAVVRSPRVAVAQMHPLLSFASLRRGPTLRDGLLYLRGDEPALAAARAAASKLGMRPYAGPLDLALYHAAAALVANGAAALATAGSELLGRAGAQPGRGGLDPAHALGPLLHSVADNVQQLGLPAALTGPVRRGDHATVAAHLRALQQSAPELVPLYATLAEAQIEAAGQLGEASPAALAEMARLLREIRNTSQI